MAGTVTCELDDPRVGSLDGTIGKLTFQVTADASGNADKTPDRRVSGRLVQLVTLPGTGGVKPSDEWCVKVFIHGDTTEVDLLAGQGEDLSDTNNEVISFTTGVLNDRVKVACSAMGISKEATVVLYFS